MSALYDKGREGILDGSIQVLTQTVKAVLVDTGAYVQDLAVHQFLSDIPPAARIATTGALTGKSATGGVFDAADTILASVTGVQSEALALFIDTANAATSRLIVLVDSGAGLPVTPNGGDITIQWDNGANKIFKL